MNLLHDLDKRGHRLTETSFWMRDSTGALISNFTGAEVVHGESLIMRRGDYVTPDLADFVKSHNLPVPL